MGMFDWVRTAGLVKCPNCNAKVKEMQTKAFENLMHTYVLIPPLINKRNKQLASTVEVHDICDKCGHWIELYLDRKNFRKLKRRKFKVDWSKLRLVSFEQKV